MMEILSNLLIIFNLIVIFIYLIFCIMTIFFTIQAIRQAIQNTNNTDEMGKSLKKALIMLVISMMTRLLIYLLTK